MPAAPVPVFDAHELRRRSNGDAAMEVELLALFVTEAERLLRQVEEAPDPLLRSERIEAMLGLARNVGALRLAQAARLLAGRRNEAEIDLQPLRTSVAETLDFLRQSAF